MDAFVYKEMANENSALLVQQIYMNRQKKTIFLAFLCSCTRKGRAGEFCEKIVDFFRESFYERHLGARIKHKLGELDKKQEIHYAGIVCADEEFVMLKRGKVEIYAINRVFLKTRARKVAINDGEERRGQMEKGVGIFLATEELAAKVKEEGICDCYGGRSDSAQDVFQARLERICEKAYEDGGRDIAAVALRN